ncbi:cell division protein FtsQ/DivIB [Blautia sp. HCP3S3_D9]|uniref:cell division protein FtsQ/DivIB n=1 Tax=unclassified Blautia TaxID=2648079 RepID=UPI0025BBB927|nr:cell division protein FtsQ/DivIB [Blautia sp.]MCI7451045.1 cell division protein FtsQ/DivIB [Blautia sp.]MDD6413898.1 cell division protein FtsQ/DivIB [Blautia sp.]MDY4114483.1 cell division protein FtsQ/DivIB [Blautia sp.]
MSKKTKKIIAGVIGAGILVAMIAFFSYYKVDSVEVRGTSHYTDEEVKKMVLRGPLASNSVLAPLFYSTTKTDDIIYVDAFKVTQLNRSTICISVKEKKIVGCIKYLDSYIYFDRNGIFVEGSQTRDETVPYFDGIQVNKIVMDEKLDIKGDTVLNTAVALSTIFQKNDMIPDHIQFDSSYSISLIYGDITVQLGKDENLEEKMNRVIAIMPKIQGKKGILHMESVSTDTNTFEEEKEEQDNTEITAENWNGGYNEDGDYTGDGEYDENGNYVGAKPKTALEEAIENWNGGYDGEGDYTGAGEYDADGNYVGPKPTQESLDAAAQENSDSSDTEDQSADTSGDSWEEDSGSYDTGYGNDSSDSSDQYDEYGNYIGDGGDYYGDEEY